MNDWFLRGDYGLAPTNYPALLLALLLAFLAGHTISWVYMLTHSGLSYSRSYVSTLIILPVIVALVMMVLANNVVLALGLMAIFAMVRFRTILRDALDTSYVLAVVVIGLACGTQKFATAVIGCAFTVVIMLYFWLTSFGTRHRYDIIVNLHWSRPLNDLIDLKALLTRHSRTTRCASQRSNEGYPGTDLSYRLLLRDPARIEDLLTELRSLNGVSRVTSLQAQDESEI
ncbi:MAG: DUF4956 domain-containing protein [Verrucomicrobia bacterium]|nr:DUF4956 domain-containing protein [Verrucomicrobiota bacterium]